jgi:hypothetical protein
MNSKFGGGGEAASKGHAVSPEGVVVVLLVVEAAADGVSSLVPAERRIALPRSQNHQSQ